MSPLSAKDLVERCLNKHPDWTLRRISNATGCSVVVIREAIEKLGLGESRDVIIQQRIYNTEPSVSLSQLEKRYDIRAAIKVALGNLPEGRLILESEMSQRVVGDERNRFRWFLDTNLAEYQDYRIKLRLDGGPARWYWGTKDTIKKARIIVDPWL